jgi:hypothetical protein
MTKEFTLEELLEAAQEGEEIAATKKRVEIHFQIKSFIKAFDLTEGKERIPTFVLYYLFRRLFRPELNPVKLKRNHFFIEISKLFTPKRTGKQRYYLLQPIKNVDSEVYRKAELYLRKLPNAKKIKKVIV